jgi:hypothetical protein
VYTRGAGWGVSSPIPFTTAGLCGVNWNALRIELVVSPNAIADLAGAVSQYLFAFAFLS